VLVVLLLLLLLHLQGAIADFEDCIRLTPTTSTRNSLKQELQLLHDASRAHLAAAVSAADKARAASWKSYGHVMIEEEPDDPAEVQEVGVWAPLRPCLHPALLVQAACKRKAIHGSAVGTAAVRDMSAQASRTAE
jgi:hypothetical protein